MASGDMEKQQGMKTMPCSQCGVPLNISGILPHTLVECSRCHAFTRTSSVLGRYHITSTLGIGGMSLVYRAKDDMLGRDVALKVLNQVYSSQPDRVKMFEHEAEVMARVSHPNVVTIYSVGDSDGCFYIAMELVEGSNLDALVNKDGKLDETAGLQIALEIAEGLRAGFEAGVLHRDMKPANVLLNMKGEAQIVDFGLSLLAGDQSTEAEIWVTPQYAPPETLQRLPEDFRSDIYAFGATMYQIFSGYTSIDVKDISISKLLEAKQQVRPLGEVDSTLSEKTCRIVDHCLQYNPEARYESYDLLISDIKEALFALKNNTSQSWREAHFRRRRKQKRSYAAYIIGGGIFVLGGILFFVGNHSQPKVPSVTKPESSAKVVENAADVLRQDQKKMAEAYLAARSFFEKKNYDEAARLFSEVLSSSAAPDATAAWASLEAYICYMLLGEDAKGRDVLDEALKRFGQASQEESVSKLMKLVELARSDALIDWETCHSFGSSFSPVYFMSGYRAWAAGKEELAKKCFQFSTQKGGEWERYLESFGKDCLQDMEALKQITQLPQYTSAQARRKIEALSQAVFKGGYVPIFLAKSSNEDLKPLVESLREQEIRMQAELVYRKKDPMWMQAQQLLKNGEYEAATSFLIEAEKNGFESNRPVFDSLAKTSGMAQGFIDGIATYLLSLGADKELTAREGGKTLVLCDIQAGAPVYKIGGRTVQGKWNDISPQALAALYKESKKAMSAVAEEKKRFRDERALNFFLLNGCMAEGAEMEKSLRAGNPDFYSKWNKVQNNVRLILGL